jgi:ATP-dependent protease Clp ATPase subunit
MVQESLAAAVLTCSFCGLDWQGFDVVSGPSPELFICRDCVELCVDIFSQQGQSQSSQAAD